MSKAKAVPKKKPVEKTPEQILCGEIADVCRLLDEESLVFLKRQADVLLHNSRVEKLRQDARKQAPPSARPEEGESEPVPAPPQPQPAPLPGVKIERTTATTFNVYVGKKRLFFNREEMRELTRICHAAENPQEGGRRLFVWLRRERTDFLIDTDIGSSSSPLLAELCDLIVHTYTVKE
jgi:hypothetical protein